MLDYDDDDDDDDNDNNDNTWRVCCHDAGKDVDDAIVLTEGVSRPAT